MDLEEITAELYNVVITETDLLELIRDARSVDVLPLDSIDINTIPGDTNSKTSELKESLNADQKKKELNELNIDATSSNKLHQAINTTTVHSNAESTTQLNAESLVLPDQTETNNEQLDLTCSNSTDLDRLFSNHNENLMLLTTTDLDEYTEQFKMNPDARNKPDEANILHNEYESLKLDEFSAALVKDFNTECELQKVDMLVSLLQQLSVDKTDFNKETITTNSMITKEKPESDDDELHIKEKL